MSAPTKRHAEKDKTEFQNKCSTYKSSKDKINVFIEWAEQNDYRLSKKVEISVEGSCAQYGLVAVDDIPEGELLFQIPRSCLLTPETCGIADLLEKDAAAIAGSSGWAPVLIALMFEYNNPKSRWRAYLDLVPDFKELDLPMFWSSQERQELLMGTRVLEAVNTDLAQLETEFKEVVLPFVQKHEDKFSPVCRDLEFYKRMVAFVMAYSFTDQAKPGTTEEGEEEEEDNPPPMMVPMADILNHIAKNNAHLNYDKDALRMVTVNPIKKGEEVFNTYGELANWDLLHMYGFSQPYPDNHYDTVDIPSCLAMQAAEEVIQHNTQTLMEQKREFLENFGFIGEDSSFVVGVEGVLSEEELLQTIKVLAMTEVEFTTHVEEEGWEEEGEEEESLAFGLPAKWKTWC